MKLSGNRMKCCEGSGEGALWPENRGDNVFENEPKVDRHWLSMVGNPPCVKATALRQERTLAAKRTETGGKSRG